MHKMYFISFCFWQNMHIMMLGGKVDYISPNPKKTKKKTKKNTFLKKLKTAARWQLWFFTNRTYYSLKKKQKKHFPLLLCYLICVVYFHIFFHFLTFIIAKKSCNFMKKAKTIKTKHAYERAQKNGFLLNFSYFYFCKPA